MDHDPLNADSIDDRFRDGKARNLSHLDRYATTKTTTARDMKSGTRRLLNMNMA